MSNGTQVFHPEANTVDEAIQFAIQRHGDTPLVVQLQQEVQAMIANKSAKFMAKYMDDAEVMADFENFLGEIGVMKRRH